MTDLIKTIEEDEDPSYLSEESESDDEFQPTKKRMKSAPSSGLAPDIDFGQIGRDIWKEKLPEISKKKRDKMTPKTSLDEKINKRKKSGTNEVIEIKEEETSDEDSSEEQDDTDSDDSIAVRGPKAKKKKTKSLPTKNAAVDSDMDDDIDLSDDELQADEIRVKEKKKKGKAGKKNTFTTAEDEEDIDDETLENDPNQAFETDLTFQQMNLSRPLLKAITSLGFIHPTPIQAAAIPTALTGRDICGCAATGTGKTAAYMLPVLERLLYKPKSAAVTRVLCLVPTRELGVQVYNVTKNLSSFSDAIEIGLAVGGLDIQSQENILRQNPDIVIATPGRLIDHLGNTPSFTLDSIEILILDEADRMLDDWFADQLKEIVRQCSPRRQTLLFSATMTDRVKDLATVSLKNPSKIFVDSNRQVAFNLRQQFVRIRNEADREAILCSLVVRTFHSKAMVFVPTKKIAHRLHIIVGLFGIRITELHGDLTQIQRLEGLRKFQKGEADVMIVTDVAARGLDIPGVASVLNFTMPPTLEQYIHRCGRTARAGRSGIAVSLVGEQDRKLMKQVAKSATLPVKARIIPIEMIGKYRDKVQAFQSEVDSILLEEEAERSLTRAEIEANKAIKMVESKKGKKKKKGASDENDGKRTWFQSHKEKKNEKERLKGRAPAKARQAAADAEDDFRMKKLTEFQARNAKKKRRIHGSGLENGTGSDRQGSKKSKRKSHFDDELTDTKSARQFRHQSKSFKGDGKGASGRGGRNVVSGKSKSGGFGGGNANRGGVNKSARKFNGKMKKK